MMQRKTLAISLALVMVLACAVPAMAFGFGPRGPAGFGFMVPGLRGMNGLELTEDQKSEIAAILDGYQETMTVAVDALLAAKQALAEAIWNQECNVVGDTIEESAVGLAYDLVAAAEKEVVLLQAQINCEVRALLTEEQIQELEERREQKMERIQQRREQMQTTHDEWIDSYLSI